MYKTELGLEPKIPFIYSYFFPHLTSTKKTQHKLSFFDSWLILRLICRLPAQKICWLGVVDKVRTSVAKIS